MAYQPIIVFRKANELDTSFLRKSETNKCKREPAFCVCYLKSKLCKLSKTALDAGGGFLLVTLYVYT